MAKVEGQGKTMRKWMQAAAIVALALAISGCEAPQGAQAQPTQLTAPAPFPMRTCVNLGNALEAETEGSWGYTVRADDLARIAAAGFDGVRLPVRWDAHASMVPPYRIDSVFMDRVVEVVDQALVEGLMVQLDMHHFGDLVENPADARQAARFVSMWRQIAERFAAYDQRLMFELLNEPFGDQWTLDRLETLYAQALSAIRRTNPDRLVIVGGLHWNNLHGLDGFTPPADPNIALTFHHYGPYEFTHQGADWLGANAPQWTRVWGNRGDIAELRADAADAAARARAYGLPIQLGEFGVINEAPLDQRRLWLSTMRSAMEAEGVAWCVWDWAVAFNIYDVQREAWVPGMQAALGLQAR